MLGEGQMKDTKKRKKIFAKAKVKKCFMGSISILLCLLITPFLSLALGLVEYSRYQEVLEITDEIYELTGISVLSDYDNYIHNRFGLLATSQDHEFADGADDLLKSNIKVLGNQVTLENPSFSGKLSLANTETLRQQVIDFSELTSTTAVLAEDFNLEDLLNNLEYCKVHDTWYYSKYNRCPLCDDKAQVKTAPKIVRVKPVPGAKGPQLVVVFSSGSNDCLYILSGNHYLNKNNQAVHITSGRKVSVPRGQKVDFSDDGKVAYVADSSEIKIYDANDKLMSTIERMPKTNYLVRDKVIYYVDKGDNFIKLEITARGNEPTYLGLCYKPLFEVAEDGRVFVASMYPKRMRIHTDSYDFDVDYNCWVNEYAIKYDKVTHHWLFVYQLSNGKFRTIVFSKDEIKYDDDVISYSAMPLGNIDFCNNTIYDPDDGKIVGTNILKGTAKEFPCSVVDEASKLEFTGRGFKIYNQDAIYKFE